MKHLKTTMPLVICLVLTFAAGAMWRPYKAGASTQSTLGMSCTTAPPSAGGSNSFYAAGAVVCVGDLDGSGVAKILLADHYLQDTSNTFWNVQVLRLSTLKTVVGRQVIGPNN